MSYLGIIERLAKRKLTEEQVAQIFVHTTMEMMEAGWPDIADFLNEHPGFVQSPELDREDFGRFLIISVVGNIQWIPRYFDNGVDRHIVQRICAKFARILDIPTDEFVRKVNQYRHFIKSVNHPSKNILRGMTRAVFYKYNLNQFQVEYFRDLNSPDPNIERQLQKLMENFLWDWQEFNNQYRVVKGSDGVEQASEVAHMDLLG
jgi:hypothetical protein